MNGHDLDIVVLGATGFTGARVVKTLAKTFDLKWGIAGRSKEKLGKLIEDLENIDLAISKVPTFCVDVNNTELLRNTVSQAKILLNCVGPNTIFSEQIVKACIESRTHYIDISAEINHILDLYRKYQKAAEDANVLIIPSCGFASIPAASGLLHLDAQFEGTLNSVECYVELDFPKRAYFPWPGNCLIHYGTWESLVYVLKNMKNYARLKQETFPEPLGPLPQEINRNFFHRNHEKLWFPYPGPDESVIEFSERYLLKTQNKRPVHFKMYTTMPLLIHFIIIPLMYLYYYLCYFNCFSKLLRRYPRFFTAGYMSHRGPSEKMMQAVTYSFTFIGKGWDSNVEDFSLPTNKTLQCKVSSCDGYRTTAIAMVFSAITLLKDRSIMPKWMMVFVNLYLTYFLTVGQKSPPNPSKPCVLLLETFHQGAENYPDNFRGGVVNVGAAFRGTKLVERLKNNGITYEILV